MEAVVRLPSRFANTTGVAPSTIETQLLVVPRSIPRILLIDGGSPCRSSWGASERGTLLAVGAGARGGPHRLRRHRHPDHRRPQQALVEAVAAPQLVDHRRHRHLGALLPR